MIDISTLDNYISSDSIIINCIGAIPQKEYSYEDYNIINITFFILKHTLNITII